MHYPAPGSPAPNDWLNAAVHHIDWLLGRRRTDYTADQRRALALAAMYDAMVERLKELQTSVHAPSRVTIFTAANLKEMMDLIRERYCEEKLELVSFRFALRYNSLRDSIVPNRPENSGSRRKRRRTQVSGSILNRYVSGPASIVSSSRTT